MKKLMIALMLISPLAANAEMIRSEAASASIARIVKVDTLSKPTSELVVNVTVQDLGGSTDMSPSKQVYFTIYRKGEMFDVEATFPIKTAFEYLGTKRLAGGVYLVSLKGYKDGVGLVTETYQIDARQAITEIKNVTCDDFDCNAATNFNSSISLESK